MSKFNPTSNTLTLNFPTPKDAEIFKSWLCGQGETDYWSWAEYRDQEDSENDRLLTNIDYHSDPNEITFKPAKTR